MALWNGQHLDKSDKFPNLTAYRDLLTTGRCRGDKRDRLKDFCTDSLAVLWCNVTSIGKIRK
jgi:hypothetical protein